MRTISGLVALFLWCSASAQVTLSVVTDKPSYLSGETIEVRVTVTNHTDTVFTLPNNNCSVRAGFDSVRFDFICVDLLDKIPFPPASFRTWVWHLQPAVFGIPSTDGEHVVFGYGGGMADSVTISASRYYGGLVDVSIPVSITPQEIQSLRDSLGVAVLYSDTLGILGVIHERWQISGHTIDSVVEAYAGDYRLNYMVPFRLLLYDSTIVSSVEPELLSPGGYSLSHNYPNPFNPTTEIRFTLGERQHAILTVYDLSGRLVSLLQDGELDAGPHSINFDATSLPSGVYFYRLQTPAYTRARSMLLVK